jgi:hypothetical protein
MVKLKLPPMKNSEDVYVYSTLIIVIVFLVADGIAKSQPAISTSLSADILKMVITLNGVLFGFTGVMIGLFTKNLSKIPKKNLRSILFVSTLAFFSYIFSILFSFLILAYGQEYIQMATLTPLFTTIFGAICASIYLLLTFYDCTAISGNSKKDQVKD